MKPIGKSILVKVEIQKQTQGGIIVPEVAQQSRQKIAIPEVVALGQDVTQPIQVGDKLILSPSARAAEVLSEDAEKFYIVNEAEVLGVY